MSRAATNPGLCPGYLLLQDRCRVLGLPTWRFDADGALLASPTEIGPVGAWLRSPEVQGRVLAAVERWTDEVLPAIAELFGGFWLIPLIENRRRRRAGYVVAAALGPEVLESGVFEPACRSAGIDPGEVAPALQRAAVLTRPMVDRLAVGLSWSQSDLDIIAQQELTLAGFSRQLAESYEEISLLYKLGKSMNHLINPRRFVALACEELQATLSYEWIAVSFLPEAAAGVMAGEVCVSGTAPCAAETLADETRRMLAGIAPDSGPVVRAAEAGLPIAPEGAQILVHPIVRDGAVVGAIVAGNKNGEDTQVSSTDMKLIDAAAGYLGILLDNAILYDDQQKMFMGTIEALTASIDAKDPYTCGHSQRVADLAAALARAHGLPEEEVERIHVAGIVHDVGKIGVPESVLCKTGRLTDDEFRLIKQHPEIGHQILKDIPRFGDVLPGVLFHHERYDGRGYPRGLAGDAIPVMARIIGLVDAFDAMSSNRTYRSAMPRSRVLEELEENAGTQFDPDLVRSFMRVNLENYDRLVEEHQAQSATGGLRIRRGGIAA